MLLILGYILCTYSNYPLSSVGLYSLLATLYSLQSHSIAQLGLQLPTLLTLFLPTLLTATLFTGSLHLQLLHPTPSPPIIKHLLLAPITEELLFRSLLLANDQNSTNHKIFITPLYFAAAHLHHAIKHYRTHRNLKNALLASSFQFSYTYLFGIYSTFLFLRTGSIYPPILSHILCNRLGFPPIFWALQRFPDRNRSIWGAYVVGIAGFVWGIWRATDPKWFGGSIFWKND